MDYENIGYDVIDAANSTNSIVITEFLITDSTYTGTKTIPEKGIISGTYSAKVTYNSSSSSKIPAVKEKTISGTFTKVEWKLVIHE